MQAQDIINGALRLIGVLASGEGASPEELADGLVTLNEMLSSWNIDRLDIYQIRSDIFNLAAGVQSYTLGIGGSLNAPRPVSIKNATAITSDGLSLPLEMVPSEGWSSIVEKSVQGHVPRKMYCDFAYPLATVLIWPVPIGTPQIELYTWSQFTSFASLTAAVDFPPGYEKAIRANLAIELAPEYGRTATPELGKMAGESLGKLQMLNKPPIEGVVEEALAGAPPAPAQAA